MMNTFDSAEQFPKGLKINSSGNKLKLTKPFYKIFDKNEKFNIRV